MGDWFHAGPAERLRDERAVDRAPVTDKGAKRATGVNIVLAAQQAKGIRALEIVGAARTGELADEAPGTVGRSEDAGVRVAAADEWVLASRLRIEGRSVTPSAVLKPGNSLMAGVWQ